MKTQAFSGIITAIITPFKKNGEVDLDSFKRLLQLQKNSGVNGVVVLGSTGEAATILEAEYEDVVCTALAYQTQDFHIYVGTGTNSTASTIEKSLKYSNLKAHGNSPSGLLIVTPYYNKPSQEHLVRHYKEVCRYVSNIPICLYNVPGRTGVNIQPQTFTKIAAQNKNIVAIKEAAGNLNVLTEMRLSLNSQHLSHVRILSGDDATFAPALLCGADGVISVTTNLFPKIMCQILSAAQRKDWSAVQTAHLSTYVANNGVFCVTNPVGIKYWLSKLNLCENILRAPLYPANESESLTLDHIFVELKQNKIEFLGE